MRPNYEYNPMLYPSNTDAWFNAGCRGTVSNDVAATGRYLGGKGKFSRNKKSNKNSKKSLKKISKNKSIKRRNR